MKKAFTIIELLIVMSVIAILVSIAIPSFRAMQNEAFKAKAQGDTRVLKLAVEAYYKNHTSFPTADATWQNYLKAETSPIIESVLCDPFSSEATTPYTYKLTGKYYVIYSIGDGGKGVMTISATGSAETTTGSPIWSTNGK